MVGAVLGAARLARAAWSLRRRLADRRAMLSGPLLESLDRMRAAAGWQEPVRLSCVPGLATPLVAAAPWGAAEICLPAWAQNELSQAQQAHLLAHELAHVVRRDSAWLWLCAALETILWFQPLHGWARRAWQAEAEFVCDDWAARLAGSRRQLAECLTAAAGRVVEGQAGLAASLAGQQAGLGCGFGGRAADGQPGPARLEAWPGRAGKPGGRSRRCGIWRAGRHAAMGRDPGD
jgi:Zn-dependent protease with chaperone function